MMKDVKSASQCQVSHEAGACSLMGCSGACKVKALAGCLSCRKALLESGNIFEGLKWFWAIKLCTGKGLSLLSCGQRGLEQAAKPALPALCCVHPAGCHVVTALLDQTQRKPSTAPSLFSCSLRSDPWPCPVSTVPSERDCCFCGFNELSSSLL